MTDLYLYSLVVENEPVRSPGSIAIIVDATINYNYIYLSFKAMLSFEGYLFVTQVLTHPSILLPSMLAKDPCVSA